VYQRWVNQRQTCLADLTRKAKALCERTDSELSTFGSWTRKELQRLVKMAKAPPTIGECRAFYARLCRLIALYRDSQSEAGTFARQCRWVNLPAGSSVVSSEARNLWIVRGLKDFSLRSK